MEDKQHNAVGGQKDTLGLLACYAEVIVGVAKCVDSPRAAAAFVVERATRRASKNARL